MGPVGLKSNPPRNIALAPGRGTRGLVPVRTTHCTLVPTEATRGQIITACYVPKYRATSQRWPVLRCTELRHNHLQPSVISFNSMFNNDDLS